MAYMFKVSINPVSVVGADKTNFPVLFSHLCTSIPASFWTRVTDTINGLDIRFYSDVLRTIEYKREVVSIDVPLETTESWIQVPILKTAEVTELYCEVGGLLKANDTDVWDDLGATEVQHFNHNYNNSSGGSSLWSSVGSPTFPAGSYGKALSLNGSSQFVERSANINFASNVVLETRIYLNALPVFDGIAFPEMQNTCNIFSRSNLCHNTYRGWMQYQVGVELNGRVVLRVALTTDCFIGESIIMYYSPNNSITPGQWHHIVVKSINHGTVGRVITMSIDGVSVVVTPSGSGVIGISGTDRTQIGAAYAGYFTPDNSIWYWNGRIEELRIFQPSVDVFDSDWSETSYNSQNDPDTFLTCGVIPPVVTGVLPLKSYRSWVTNLQKVYSPYDCPVNYLPYLSRFLGYNLKHEDFLVTPEDLDKKRIQVKELANWYRIKGVNRSFSYIFEILEGATGTTDLNPELSWVRLWDSSWNSIPDPRDFTEWIPLNFYPDDLDPDNPGFDYIPAYSIHATKGPNYVPDSRLRLDLSSVLLTAQDLKNVLDRLEEVKPYHLIFDFTITPSVVALLYEEFFFGVWPPKLHDMATSYHDKSLLPDYFHSRSGGPDTVAIAKKPISLLATPAAGEWIRILSS